MKTKKLTKGTIGFVETKPEWKDFVIETNQSHIPYTKELVFEIGLYRGLPNYDEIELGEGNWTILGKSNSLTEEQLSEIMTKVLIRVDVPARHSGFMDFNRFENFLETDQFIHSFETALESYKSLKQELDICDENPLGSTKPEHSYDVLWDQEGDDAVDDWHEAQSKVRKYITVYKED